MDISKQLKEGVNPKEVARKTINFMRHRSNVARIQVLMQWIVNTGGSDYIVSEAVAALTDFSDFIKKADEGFVIQDYNSKYMQRVSEYINELITEGRRLSVLFRNDWLSKISIFLLAMSAVDSLKMKSLASFLSIELLTHLIPLLQDLYEHEVFMSRLSQKSGDTYGCDEIPVLFSLSQYLLAASEEGISFKPIGAQIAKKICNIHETMNVFYTKDNKFIEFYIICMETKNMEITLTALGSIQKILENDKSSESSKMEIINYLLISCNANTLINLILDGFAKTQIGALLVTKLVHKFVNGIHSWGANEYNHLYYKTFHKNKEIRSIAGEILLKRLENIHPNEESEILLELMEFFLRYNADPADLLNYVDAVWSFEYMKNFENIWIQYKNDQIPDISKVMVGHFIKAILTRMNENKEKYDENIKTLFKKLPIILRDLEDFPGQYASLLSILSLIDLNMYKYITIGSDWINYELATTLSRFIRNTKDYVFKRNALYYLKQFCELDYVAAQCEIDTIGEEIFNSFMVADSSELKEVQDIDGHVMSFGATAMALSHLEFFSDEQENAVFDRLNEYFKKPVQELWLMIENDDNQKEIFTFKIESYSAILQKKVIKILNYGRTMSMIEPVLVETLKKNIQLFIDLLQKLIVKNLTLFLHEKIFSALIDILLTTQKKLQDNMQKLAEMLIFDVSLALYGTIIDFAKERLFDESSETFNLNGKQTLTELELKRNILEKVILLHTTHIDLPQSANTWKLITYFGDKHDFQNEIEILAETILNYKTNVEPEFARFCKVAAVLIHHYPITGLTAKINKLVTFIKKNFNDNNENVKIICSGILMQFIDLLAESLRISWNISDIRPIASNRLRKLKYMNAFVVLLDNVCRNKVKEHSRALCRHVLLSDENQCAKDFQRLLN